MDEVTGWEKIDRELLTGLGKGVAANVGNGRIRRSSKGVIEIIITDLVNFKNVSIRSIVILNANGEAFDPGDPTVSLSKAKMNFDFITCQENNITSALEVVVLSVPVSEVRI